MALYDLLGNNSNNVVTYQGLINFLRCNGLLAPPLLEFSLQEKVYYVPGAAFADPDNPTEAEVIVWAAVNISPSDRENGSILAYVLNGTTNNPDWVWVYDQSASAPSTQVLTRLKSPILVEEKEKVYYVPSGAFADVNNPTDAEAITYALANISLGDRENGSILVYILNGTINNPDWIWVYNESAVDPNTEVLTRLKSPYVLVLEEKEFELPPTAFTDPYRPITAEAEAYAVLTYSLEDRRNGVILSYRIPDVTADYSFVWVGNVNGAGVGTQVLTLIQEEKTDVSTVFVSIRGTDSRAQRGDPLRPWGQTMAGLYPVVALNTTSTVFFYSGHYAFIDVGGAKPNPTTEVYYEISGLDSANLWRLRHGKFYFTPGTIFWLRNSVEYFRLFSNTVNVTQANFTHSVIGGVLEFRSGDLFFEGAPVASSIGMTLLHSPSYLSTWIIENLFFSSLAVPIILAEGLLSVDFQNIFLASAGRIQLYKNDNIATLQAMVLRFNVTSTSYHLYDTDGKTYVDPMIQISGTGNFYTASFYVIIKGILGVGRRQSLIHATRSTFSCAYSVDFKGDIQNAGLVDTDASYATNVYGGASDFRDSFIVFSASTHTDCHLDFMFKINNLGGFGRQCRIVSFNNATFLNSHISIVFRDTEWNKEPLVYLQNVSLNNTVIRIHFENVLVDEEAAVVVCQGLTLSNGGKVLISGDIRNRRAGIPIIKTSHPIHLKDMTIITNGADEVETDAGAPIDVVIHGTLQTNELAGHVNINYVGGTVSRLAAYG